MINMSYLGVYFCDSGVGNYSFYMGEKPEANSYYNNTNYVWRELSEEEIKGVGQHFF